jgi:alpha/beta superfamily hydrolase
MNVHPALKPALWGAAGGAVALAIIGFTWGGWVTAGTASQMVKKESDIAIVKMLAPICVDKFQQQPDATASLAALMATNSYQRASFIEKGGWATMVGSDKPYSGTAQACAELLGKLVE